MLVALNISKQKNDVLIHDYISKISKIATTFMDVPSKMNFDNIQISLFWFHLLIKFPHELISC